MSSLRFPVAPKTEAGQLVEMLKDESNTQSDRRTLLKRAAAVGLSLPALAALGIKTAGAQATPEPGYSEAGPTTPGASTGLEAPQPGGAQPFKLYDPFLQPVEAGTKDITVVSKDITAMIAKNVPLAGWAFDGSIPGRALRVVEGDTVNFTFKVDPASTVSHSLDFHSAKVPPDQYYKTIQPGEEFSWSFTATTPGAFMYHCATPPVLMHIGSGMYGVMIVDPKEGWSPAQELVFVQSDFSYVEGPDGVFIPDYTRMLGGGSTDIVAFNGYANQYVENPINVNIGEPIRIFIMNAGPNAWSTFHIIGGIIDRGYINAHPKNELFGLQSIAVGPGDGACVEFTLDEPGDYVALNHSFGYAAQGAIATLHAE